MTHALFVYGTLMTDHAQAPLLGACTRRAASVPGALWTLPAGYPALCLEGHGTVHGELVEGVSDAQLALLDAYEGVGEELYRRVRVQADWGLRRTEAWAYVMDNPRERGGTTVPSGRWRGTRRR